MKKRGTRLMLGATVALLMNVSCAVDKAESNNDSGLGEAFAMVTTADKSMLLAHQNLKVEDTTALSEDKWIKVNSDTQYQKIDGFGYSLTGGSAMHMHNMSDKARHQMLTNLFSTDSSAIGVSYLRISIGASDMDAMPFSYNDLPDGQVDEELSNFSLAQDTLHLVPLLKEILAVNPDIKILGSPWSPPAWMKDNNDTKGGSLLPKYYNAYAHYFVKYIKAMKSHGIALDAITIQNEPLHPGNNPSLLMPAEQQAEFVKNHLGPLFKAEGIKTKIIVYDHNADRIDYPLTILRDSAAAQYVDGSAFHLYGGAIDELSKVHEEFPDKNLYFTEQWIGAPGDFGNDIKWHTKELIIGATRNWCKTVLEWNLATDSNYEPHTAGGCDKCLGALTIDGDDLTLNPAYYIIAHASKYVRPGAVRIQSGNSNDLLNVSFKTPDNKIVIIVLNNSATEQSFALNINNSFIEGQLTAGAVGTYVYNQ